MTAKSSVRAQWKAAFESARARWSGTPDARPVPTEGMSGLEMFRATLRGELPPAPIGRTLDFYLIEAEEGRVAFLGNPRHAHYNPTGAVHGGWSATLLDSCMACAVHTLVPAGQSSTTVELKVNFLRPISEATGPVRAEGRIIQVGSRIATAEGRLSDADGKLCAHGTTTCLIFKP